MEMIASRKVVDIISKTLSYVDPRLVDHGGRVANTMFQVLRRQKKYNERQIRDICILGLIHDIGAYKTEEIDRLAHFETENVWAHSIYGYLFVKHISPLGNLAPALFFHHAGCDDLLHAHESCREIAQLIHIADRMDIMALTSGVLSEELFHRYFDRERDRKFRGDLLDVFAQVLFDPAYREEHYVEVLDTQAFTREEVEAYLKMMVLSIDFRSSQTVTHTVTATGVSGVLADLMGMDDGAKGKVVLGAMLHDLGKQGIPPEILEAPGRLSDKAMAIMRTHVELTAEILRDNVDEDVFNIAVRHHEKLDGSGYPQGLTAGALRVSERLVTVADILSALIGVRSYKQALPKDRVVSIICEMRDQGTLDPHIVQLAVDNYDFLMDEVGKGGQRTIDLYNLMNDEFERYTAMTANLSDQTGLLLSSALEWQ